MLLFSIRAVPVGVCSTALNTKVRTSLDLQPGSVAQSDGRSTGDQEGVSSRLRSGNILSLRLIRKSFLRSFSPIR